jgi:signal transduction histidine kinase
MGQSSFNPDSLHKVLASEMDEQSKMNAYLELGKGYMTSEIYDSAILTCDSAIRLAAILGDKAQLAELNITKGNALFYSAGPERGLEPYRESFLLFVSIGDSAGIAKALNGMGVMYKKMGQNDSAVSCYIQLVTIAEKNGYQQTLGMGYVNLGILYQDMLEFEKATHYLDLSIPINEKYRTDLVAMAFMNKGMIYHEKKEYDSALVRYRQALMIYSALNKRKNLADLYNNFGNLYFDSSDLDSANHYYNKAREIYEEIGDWYTFCQVYHNLALVKIEEGNNDKALVMLDSCLILAKQTGNTELESLAYKSKFLAFTKKGMYRQALENYLCHDSVKEIIYNLEKEELMADLEMKYQNEKKQAQIFALERDYLKKSKQNNIYLFTAIGIITLVTFAFLYFRQRAVKDRIIAQQRIRQLEEEKKLLAAKSLVEGQEEERKRIAGELHDGLGVLLSTTRIQFSAIRDKSPENEQLIDKAARLLEQASSDVRKISHNMMPGLLTKLGLYEAVQDLFDNISETEGLTVRANIPEEAERLPENKEIMIYRIIQEVVNNTLKHADAKNIEIQMQCMPGKLDVIYSDDGKGFNVEEKLGIKSLGLTSIQSRINFLNGTMRLFSEPGKGVSYKFEIPL